jgi:hypothetical protein
LVFEIAKKEFPRRLVNSGGEQFIIHRGFKTGLKNGEYVWKDVRHDNFYNEVDPLITEKVLELGFDITLKTVMVHDDKNKLLILSRRMERIDAETMYWVNMSTEIWNRYKRQQISVANRSASKELLKKRTEYFKRSYKRKRALYNKKRRILKEEKEEVFADYVFYDNRIKTYNRLI